MEISERTSVLPVNIGQKIATSRRVNQQMVKEGNDSLRTWIPTGGFQPPLILEAMCSSALRGVAVLLLPGGTLDLAPIPCLAILAGTATWALARC